MLLKCSNWGGRKWKEVEIEGKGGTKQKKNLEWILAAKSQKVKKTLEAPSVSAESAAGDALLSAVECARCTVRVLWLPFHFVLGFDATARAW